MAVDLYQILEVSAHATDEEIRRAYFTLVRKYPPQTDPEGFKRLKQAYDILRNPRSRQEYDAVSEHGEEINRLQKQAEAAQKKEDWLLASRYYGRIVKLNPYDLNSRFELGYCYLKSQRNLQAIDTFVKLAELEKKDPGVWLALGLAYFSAIMADPDKNGHYRAKAQEAYEKAVELRPGYGEPYRELAQLLLYFEDYQAASSCLEDGIKACGNDPELILLLCSTYLKLNQQEKLIKYEKTFQEKLQDQEKREAFARLLVDRAWRALRNYEQAEAQWFIKQAHALHPEKWDQDFVIWVDSLKEIFADRMQVKGRVIKPLADLVELMILNLILTKEELSDEDFDSYLDDCLKRIYNNPPEIVIQDIEVLQNEFPTIYRQAPSLLASIKADCFKALESGKTPQANQTGQNSGGALGGAVIGGIIGAAGGPVGIAVGAWLGSKIGKFLGGE